MPFKYPFFEILFSLLEENLMKTGKHLIFSPSFLLLLATLRINTMADRVNQTTEIQGKTTSTYIYVVGLAGNSTDLAWTSNEGSSQTTLYSENTNVINDHIVYVKGFNVNTGDQSLGQSNVKFSRQITFEGF